MRSRSGGFDKPVDNEQAPTGKPERDAERRTMTKEYARAIVDRWIRAINKAKIATGKSWEEITADAHINKKTPQHWVVGEGNPNLVTFLMLLDAFGLEIRIVRKKDGRREKENAA